MFANPIRREFSRSRNARLEPKNQGFLKFRTGHAEIVKFRDLRKIADLVDSCKRFQNERLSLYVD